jgi:hypothetical protein
LHTYPPGAGHENQKAVQDRRLAFALAVVEFRLGELTGTAHESQHSEQLSPAAIRHILIGVIGNLFQVGTPQSSGSRGARYAIPCGEALAALRTAQKMLRAAHLSFTDVAQSFGSGVKVSGGSHELVRLPASCGR